MVKDHRLLFPIKSKGNHNKRSTTCVQSDELHHTMVDTPTELHPTVLHHQRKRNVLFNDALNTFYLRLYGVGHMVKGPFLIVRKETRCRHIGYSYRLTARVLLYAPSHRQDSTYHSLCYTNRRALAGTRNSSMGPHHEGSIQRPIAP